MSRWRQAALLVVTIAVSACRTDAPSTPAAVPTLRELAASRRLLIGAAANRSHLGEAAYVDTLGRELSMLEPENEMKFGPLRPTPETFSWSAADELVAFAESRRMKVRGHTFVWHQSLPAWLSSLSSAQLETVLRDHITTVAQRYRGRVFAWDVANEIFASDNGSLRSSLWHDRPGIGLSGTAYAEQAFRWAAAADPAALLFYNDFNAEAMSSGSFPGFGAGLLFDRDYRPKPAVTAVRNRLAG